MSSNINSTLKLIDGLFPNSKLTKIIGVPAYKTINTLQREATANASSVPSSLSNGAMGHFGLVHDAATVAILAPNFPYDRPIQPAVPNFAGLTAPQIANLRGEYDQHI